MSDALQLSQTLQFDEPKFGFNSYSEPLNGREAMVGFVLTILIELITGKDALTWLGLIRWGRIEKPAVPR